MAYSEEIIGKYPTESSKVKIIQKKFKKNLLFIK